MSVIKNLEKYNKEPNTVTGGTLYIGTVKINNLEKDERRNIRIYLPTDYDDKKRFPVIYMMDGKNLFDKHTSFAGEWGVDEILEERLNKKEQTYIIVGIDSALDGMVRVEEMLPNNNNLTDIDDIKETIPARGDILGKWIVNELKPEIDKTFKTLSDKNNTAIAGSSMGGLFSFYMGFKYPEVFNMIFAFSPAFCLYDEKYFKEEFEKINIKKYDNKLYLLVGDVEYENQFVSLTKYTYNRLLEMGMKKDSIKYVHDLEGIHHETFWNKYFNDAIKHWEK